MAKTYFDGTGRRVLLGKELGRGGEGSVFDVQGEGELAAKIYHSGVDAQKQAKLRHMVQNQDAQLLKYTAWPQQTIHASANGPVVGFLMRKLPDMTAAHMMYGPSYRKQNFPERGWDFLVYCARNVAAAFTVLHVRRHVLGDINQGNAYLSSKTSAAVLIDADSYQIDGNGTTYDCEVGVSHFTPPELQGISSFRGVRRTTNHDGFGLALLIFHLLFGGRHPFAGMPQRDDVGESLEDNIKQFRFAYSATAAQRLIAPPPLSIPIGVVPHEMAQMFEAAFTESGARGQRPTARQWMDALDRLRGNLRKCQASTNHTFSNHLAECPWCALQRQGVQYFAPVFPKGTAFAGPVSIGEIWNAILAVRPPAAPPVPKPVVQKPTPRVRPVGYVSNLSRWVTAVVVIAFYFIMLSAAPKSGGLIFLFCVVALGVTYGRSRTASTAILNERKAALTRAKNEQADAIAAFEANVGPRSFEAKRKQLSALKDEFNRLPATERKALDDLRKTAEERQLKAYLQTFFIETAALTGIGPAKRASLSSFGIETAADVEWLKVRGIKGFGDKLTGTLVTWRNYHEARFKFDPAKAVTDRDRATVRADLNQRAYDISRHLQLGLQQLKEFEAFQTQLAARHTQAIQAAAQRVAQAEADMSVL
ncbi:helix-hairpin-helix domain-containing protein [Dyella nitratireducens]|uniref:Protein kinase domain-containing protein n=1 Tax=Dyella nitratireducens TaxID=1849580 RepID=A0ABQ1FKQ3_9GAMM|nr:helix-hairpin-helix domain-containing protein [Dyella nitratireducens]GGA17083.1 hypothetical protein GCM10010981_01010 [Dyella nitratireducens]GLQ44838.1 hypothetical protein GCM10007902_46880 [Dyella nitratireducens]